MSSFALSLNLSLTYSIIYLTMKGYKMRRIITSMDIGSNTIKIVVGEMIGEKINILCALNEETKGFKNHEIIDEDLLKLQIRSMLDTISEQLGCKVRKVIVNLPTSSNGFVISEVTNTITNEDGIVTSNDILRILQTSAYNKIRVNDELIGVMPIYFRLDNEEMLDPYEMSGKELSAKVVLITAPRNEVVSMVSLLEKCGVEVIDITTTGLVDYYNFKNPKLDERTGIVVNIGHYKTSLSVFSKGLYINNEVLNIGGAYIDRDISFIYKFKLTDCKYLKENLALANIRKANPKENVRLVNKTQEELTINQYELTEIVASRLSEMLKLIKKSINLLTKKEISYIIITGGLTELKDFPLALASVFGENVKIGSINTIGLRHNQYSTALGMIRYFNEKLRLRHKEYSTFSEDDAESMCTIDAKLIASDSILGKVFGYFFDS